MAVLLHTPPAVAVAVVVAVVVVVVVVAVVGPVAVALPRSIKMLLIRTSSTVNFDCGVAPDPVEIARARISSEALTGPSVSDGVWTAKFEPEGIKPSGMLALTR